MSEPILTKKNVDDLVLEAFYADDQIVDGKPPEGAVLVVGITRAFGFDPEKVEGLKPRLRELLRELPPEFFSDSGGGWSFLNLNADRHGRQWGDHPTMEALCCLAIAAGFGRWCAPRDLWKTLPGGMPYVSFDLRIEAGDEPEASLEEIQHEVRGVQEDIAHINDQIEGLEAERRELEKELLELAVQAAQLAGTTVKEPVLGRVWTCPPLDDPFKENASPEQIERWKRVREENPLKVCLYDHASDPCHDHCVFCEWPEERK